jgi:transcriptional regulator with GAF, ATPase, and Fis domain
MPPEEPERPTMTMEGATGRPGSSRRVPGKLVVVAGPDEGAEAPVDGTVRVGTAPNNDLQLGDPRVSRNHGSFSLVDGRLVYKDLGSSNGSFLDGTRVMEVEVPLGATLGLGPETKVSVQPRWHMREVQPSRADRFGGLLGRSVAMRELFAVLERVATTDVPVLIEGETGTGKEVTARSIHDASPRAGGPYVVFDCGAVPRELAESELFGHKRGAFSGAVADRAGAFQRADGGTLLLDEIGELPLELQPKLLRALETHEVRPVGEDVARAIDVRVLAATNRELHAETRRGAFRSDLLFRLDVVRVRLPPLRHRPEDIPMLVEHLLKGRLDPGERVEGAGLERLLGYAWPGNVRELRNVLARAAALAGGPRRVPRFGDLVFNLGASPVEPSTFGVLYPGIASPVPYKEAKERLLGAFERAYVAALLDRHEGNMSRAAAAAGLSRKHLYDLVRRLEGAGEEGREGDDGEDRDG